MRPFMGSFPYVPKQIQNEGSNGSASGKVTFSDPCVANVNNLGSNLVNQSLSSACACSNPLASTNALHSHLPFNSLSVQFPIPMNNSDTLLSNVGGNAMTMMNRPPLLPSPCFLNVSCHPHLVQNSQIGMPFLGSAPIPHLHQSNGRFYSQNNLQNMNPSATFPVQGPLFNLLQSSNHMIPCQSPGQFFGHNHPQGENLCAHMVGAQIHSLNPSQNMNQSSGFAHSQFFSQNPIGNVNQLLPMQCSQHSVNPSQVLHNNVALCSSSSIGSLNQVGPNFVAKNSGLIVNQQLDMQSSEAVKNNRHNLHVFNPMGQNLFPEPPVPIQNEQGNFLPSVQTQEYQKNAQPSGFQLSQESNTKYCRNNNTKWRIPKGTTFPRNNCEFGRRAPSGFQNSQFHQKTNTKGKFGSFKGKGRKAYDREERKSHFADSMGQTRTEHRRSLPLNYTEQEIQQWREERRKNYPSKANFEKKLAERQKNSEINDRNAKTRRQQLKEILAKQAELGVEVADIPPQYLSESENQVSVRAEEKKVWRKKGRYQNKYGKRGQHGPDRRVPKKQKLEDNGPSTMPTLSKRKQTLLQKLLSADIKRDKSHLLQVFRFMVLNSFFKDWPEKPLKFPSIIVKGTGGEGEVIEEKCSLQPGNDSISGIKNSMVMEFDTPKEYNIVEDGEDKNQLSDENAEDEAVIDGKTDCIKEDTEKSEEEEGEITD